MTDGKKIGRTVTAYPPDSRPQYQQSTVLIYPDSRKPLDFGEGTVGPAFAQSMTPGTCATNRLGQLGDMIVSSLHGKFYEQAYRGNLYSVGMTSTALSADTITLTATTTPIVGVWNPITSTVNLVIAKATLQISVAGNSAVAPGAFVWASSVGNGAITTGITPLNRKTLSQVGSQAKGFNISTALTGLSNNLVIRHAAGFGSLVAAQPATAVPLFSGGNCVEDFDGSLIVPPGGVLALLNTTSTTTVSVASMLLWEEVPV